MSVTENTYDRIIRYLKDQLSNRERHHLEKEMMQDTFDEEAFEGLNQLSADELETDMDRLMSRLDERIEPQKKRNLVVFYRIAAAIILLVGIGSIFYVVFRTPSQDFITQENNRERQIAPAEKVIPAEPASPVNKNADTDAAAKTKGSTEWQKEETPEASAPALNAQREAAPLERYTEEELSIADKSDEPVIQPQMESPPIKRHAAKDQPPKKTITAKVVDSDGEALPGVSIMEKGSAYGTITDVNGNFSLQVGDTVSKLSLSYIGYLPLELKTSDAAGKNIAMQEDIIALDEVVVVGYGTQKRSEVTGAVSSAKAVDIANGEAAEPYNIIKPVPPGGSLKAFKEWVKDRIDTKKIQTPPGKHRIQVMLTVQASGLISNIRLKSTAPSAITDEYRRVISQSPPWTPALNNNVPVDAEVVIRFVITVE
jgi:hypothetical protein